MKDGGLGLQYEVIVVIWVVSAFCKREKLKIKRAWQINHPVLLTPPPSLSEDLSVLSITYLSAISL